jgi:3-oxoadipate enol-lactonase
MIFESGDAELFYAASGAGPDVVLLHPTPVDHNFWNPLNPALAGYRLILPDLRGHGRSHLGSSAVSIGVLAQDVIRLLDTLDISKAHLVGCSIGGYVLYELWRRAPERIGTLSIFCSKPQPDSGANKTKRRETIADVQANGTDVFFDTMAQSLVGTSAQRRDPGIAASVRGMMGMPLESVVAIQRALGERPDSVPTAKTITVPMLVVAGGEDASSSPAEMEVLAQSARSAEYHVIADGGHYAAFEQPQLVGAKLRKFLDRHPL